METQSKPIREAAAITSTASSSIWLGERSVGLQKGGRGRPMRIEVAPLYTAATRAAGCSPNCSALEHRREVLPRRRQVGARGALGFVHLVLLDRSHDVGVLAQYGGDALRVGKRSGRVAPNGFLQRPPDQR